MTIPSRRVLLAAPLALPFLGTPALAQPYPARSIRMVVPYAPGGVSDIAARLLAEGLTRRTGAAVVIENRPGAGGIVGTDVVAKAAPDGYTLLVATNGEVAINPAVYPTLPYDPQRDLRPLAMLTETPLMWAASTASGHTRLQDLLDAARARSGEVNYATPGNGTMNHLTGEWFAMAAGIRLQHIPYRGGAPAAMAVAGGEVPFGVLAVSSALPHVQGGRMQALAATTSARSTLLPDMPTVSESGIRDFDAAIWVGLFAPSGVSDEAAAWLERAALDVVGQPEFLGKLTTVGAVARPLAGVALGQRLREDAARFQDIARRSNIKPG
ncbi:Bug family tripartite tricarboxylate transporter substrate binding protein [Roseomonas populi]|uniref:Tripartite tricarboxylate transporter substrate binding protein n=1 Tax=Roseomonas populi TaxID=3121582 RepID=A0ABT1X6Q4_9PROT|nr:tripartite tricarboxylate transporter substrate binding protein [Roseomonas pecuniae]MCR0983782.1 tripartite tricarboxylate transporter substrate binding protein [Roseomonas pecuniae]